MSAGLCYAWDCFYSRFCSSRHTPTQWLVTGDEERKDDLSADANRLKDTTVGWKLGRIWKTKNVWRERRWVKERERWEGGRWCCQSWARESKGKGAGSDGWLTCPCTLLGPLLPLIIIIITSIIPRRRQWALWLYFTFLKQQYRESGLVGLLSLYSHYKVWVGPN